MNLCALALLASFTGTPSSAAPALASAQVTAEGLPADGIRWGQAVLTLSDLDGDGVRDFAVGAPAAEVDGRYGAGMVLVVSGSTGHRLARWSFDEGYGMGATLTRGSDADGDGFDEVLVGAGTHGRTEVWSCAKAQRLFFFEALSDRVHSIGDVDLDGTGDYLVTGPEDGGLFSGKDGSALETVQMEAFLSNLLSVGDLDGDGISDGILQTPAKLLLSAAPIETEAEGAPTRRAGELFPKASRVDLRGPGSETMLATGDRITAAVSPLSNANTPAERPRSMLLTVHGPEGKTSLVGFALDPDPALKWRVEVDLGYRGGKWVHDRLTPLDDLNGDGVGDVLLTASPQPFGAYLGVFSGADGKKLWDLDLPDVGTGTMVTAGRADDLNGDGAGDVLIGLSQGYVLGVPTAYPLGQVSILSSASGEDLATFTEVGRVMLEAFLDEAGGVPLLLIHGPERAVKEQMQLLARDYQGASQRNVTVLDLSRQLPTARIGDLKVRPKSADVRRHFALTGDAFQMVLVNRAGAVTQRYSAVTTAKEVWRTLDGEL